MIYLVRQVNNVVLKGQPLVGHGHRASFHRNVKGCYLLRTARKYVGGMRSSSHDVMVGRITVKAWFELLVECATDNFFLALERQPIAGPILRVDSCSTKC